MNCMEIINSDHMQKHVKDGDCKIVVSKLIAIGTFTSPHINLGYRLQY